MKNNYDKWKTHFFEMKGGVGMSSHKKESEQEDAFTQTQTIHNPIMLTVPALTRSYIHLCSALKFCL